MTNWEKLGKVYYLGNQLGLDFFEIENVDGIFDTLTYCVDTYDVCIESVSFQEWAKKGNTDGRPVIFTANEFKTHFSEIAENCATIKKMIKNIEKIYNIDFWTNNYYNEKDAIIYTTMYDDSYNKIDNKSIAIAMERLMTLSEIELDTESDREEFVASINLAMNNYLENTKITATDELLYKVNDVTGGYLE